MATITCQRVETIVLGGDLLVTPEPQSDQTHVSLAPTSPVRIGKKTTSLAHVLSEQYVKFTAVISSTCNAKGLPQFSSLDQYLRQWQKTFSPGDHAPDVRLAVDTYVNDFDSQFELDEPHLIADPKRCAEQLTTLAKQFGGTFQERAFLRTARPRIAAALAPLAKSFAGVMKQKGDLRIARDDFLRLVRAENLAKAWLPKTHPVRRQLKGIMNALEQHAKIFEK